ncbi:MAG: cytochrome c3 family protein [Pirellulaceae bacterium]
MRISAWWLAPPVIGVLLLLLTPLGVALYRTWSLPEVVGPKPGPADQWRYATPSVTLRWGQPTAANSEKQLHPLSSGESNIARDDYSGPESCRKCHPKNHEQWSQHPHRWMNALAEETTVKGDFTGGAEIRYLGGLATFYRADGEFRMKLERDDVTRVYRVTQTIGSRFYQYYVGRIVSGPPLQAPEALRDEDHVLPFGYWLDEKEWVPVVHIGAERPDGLRDDPFSRKAVFDHYASRCNSCHTTFALGDMLLRHPHLIGAYVPRSLKVDARSYLEQERPEFFSAADGSATAHERSNWNEKDVGEFVKHLRFLDAVEHSVTLGVSCEACHLGARQHALDKAARPKFFPKSPHVYSAAKTDEIDFGRSRENVNWACGRCHSGYRRQFPGGMGTWNSIEYTDAMQGSCYSQLTCITCHDPHQATGPKWPRTPAQDDALCLQCHQQFEPPEARAAHTHHPAGSSGDRCMNCHMPRINEGLQDVVRTHTIFSPTNRRMIEDNAPNACNLCHLDQSIDWTVGTLSDWYGAEFTQSSLDENYSRRDEPVGVGWLKKNFESTRLVAADALCRTNSRWALPELIEALDDPYLLNRQFTAKGLETMLEIELEDFGYRHYMTPEERRAPIERIRAAILAPREDEK